MRTPPDGQLRLAIAGAAGAVWGLGLARLAAEAGFCPSLYSSRLAVGGVALVCGGVTLALGQRTRNPAPLFLVLLYVTGFVSTPLGGAVLLIGGAVAALLMMWGERVRWLPPALLGLATLALYMNTLLPSLGQADTFEFQVIVPRLGVAHPTGYPLYVLLGRLFTLLPVGNVAWRVNLASAVFAAGAVLILYLLLLRLTSHWIPAFVAALSLAVSATFWSQAIVAEVYALHNLLVAAIMWLLLPPYIPPIGGDRKRGAAHRWQAVFFLLGLSLTNHLTTALLFPAAALALLWERPRLRLRDWLSVGGLFLLGLSLYLFIPLRWPALNHGARMSLHQFAAYVTGGQFHGALQLASWRDPTRWAILWRLLLQPFGWIGLGLAGIGAARMVFTQRRALALTGVTFLAFAFYGLSYHVPDISVFLLPAHLILALWIGIAGASMQVGKYASKWSRELAALLIFLPLWLIWTNLPLVDQSHNRGNLAWGRYVLSLPLEKDSALLADMTKFAPLYYLQQIEGARPDLDLLVLGNEGLYQAELAARLDAGQTVYLARYLPHLEGLYLRSVGPVVQVGKDASGQVCKWASVQVGKWASGQVGKWASGQVGKWASGQVCKWAGLQVDRWGEIRLLGTELSRDPQGRPLYHLTLCWQADNPVSSDLVVRLRMVDAAGRVRWESGGARPVNGLYPTNGWPAGVPVADYHEISLPPWLPRGEYTLQVGLFPPFSDTGEADWRPLKTLPINPPSNPPPLPYQRRNLFTGGAWLTGYDVAGAAPAGAPFTADLAWRGVEQEEKARLTWVDAHGRTVAAAPFPLAAGTVRSRYVITAPQTAGNYTLRVGLMDRAARCNWLSPPTGDCPLATVEVTPAQEGLANFADLALLLDAELGLTAAHPGETVPVSLRWRALRATDEDYTVFVHLIGPDGQLHGQIDAWPVQGSYPTSQWEPGAEIADPYRVQLAADAPPGHYRVEVGWYLLATMQRLPTVDANGHPNGDSFIAGEFEVSDR